MLTNRLSKPLHAIHRNVPSPAFDLTDVGPVKSCLLGKGLLGQLRLLAGKSQLGTKTNLGWRVLDLVDVFGLHNPKIAV